MSELEMGRSFAPELPEHVETVLQQFYEAQRKRHQDERERFERMGLRKSTARWNRQELYLEETQRNAAMADSRRHLLKHPEWWSASLSGSLASPLSAAQLRAVVAAQHFFQVDCYDVSLPPELRRSEDVYGNTDGEEMADISEQFMLDAPRSTYVIEGEVMDYAAEQRANNAGESLASVLEKDPMAAEHRKAAFTKRLIASVRHLLTPGQSSKPAESTLALLRATTTTLSQSGMASLERACESTQVAVSGGEQLLNYNLKRLPGDRWELSLEVKKVKFRNAIFCSAAAPDADPIMKEFGPGSEFLKSCRLVLSPIPSLGPKPGSTSASPSLTSTTTSSSASGQPATAAGGLGPGSAAGGSAGGVEVDLLELNEEAKLFDGLGKRLPWPLPEVLALEVAEAPPPPPPTCDSRRPGRRSFAHRLRFFLSQVFRTCSSLCRRMRLWWARLRGRNTRQQ